MAVKRRKRRTLSEAVLPSYKTAAEVLEKKNGSGLRLVGWTFARSALIVPPLLVVGIDWKKAIAGGLVASILISGFTLLRIADAGRMFQAGRNARARTATRSR